MPFKLIYKYYSYISYKKDLNLCSKLRTVEELFSKLKELMTICQQNLYHTQKLQKQACNKGIKP